MNTQISFDLGQKKLSIQIPAPADILAMKEVSDLQNPQKEILNALQNPIGTLPLSQITAQKLALNPHATAVIVISDNTRPVPYKGKEGILYPIIEQLLKGGLMQERISILVATGTHLPLGEKELREMLDPRIFEENISIVSHDCRNTVDLVCIGTNKTLGPVYINRAYMESDIKILTGLVESHFMAGVSGGRKAICPGLLSEKSIQIIHGGEILSSPDACDLELEKNPVHKEALAVAKMAGCDMIVNVTLDSKFKLTGVYSGDLEKAHLKAVEKLQTYISIPVQKKYDLVITHAGFVGINHYQAAKAGTLCAALLKKNGICILAANHIDSDPVGSSNYKSLLKLLKEKGSEQYESLIKSKDWSFTPDQWEPQMWARLFKIIPFENLIYCCEEIPSKDFEWIPGTDGRIYSADRIDSTKKCNLETMVNNSVHHAIDFLKEKLGRDPEIAVIKDGPYGIPVWK